jgi:hypothetical protein
MSCADGIAGRRAFRAGRTGSICRYLSDHRRVVPIRCKPATRQVVSAGFPCRPETACRHDCYLNAGTAQRERRFCWTRFDRRASASATRRFAPALTVLRSLLDRFYVLVLSPIPA